MMMNVNSTSSGGPFAIYTDIESLCNISGTNIMLYAKYTSIKNTYRQ